ncbi:Hypothetical predicted protein [Pelobates cultripes]|uniref:Uncharacterized protein n=1 Tax=Pelobates cultripes TaxID=61616 RepID=A0AAD1W6V0_PELCU|nr:Hypothetical predicted protein [Pelobates cultripes]
MLLSESCQGSVVKVPGHRVFYSGRSAYSRDSLIRTSLVQFGFISCNISTALIATAYSGH